MIKQSWEKLFAKDTSDKGLSPKIYKELLTKENKTSKENCNIHLIKGNILTINKHRKRSSILYVIRETMKYYTPIRTAKIQNSDTTKCQLGCGTTEIFLHCWWEFIMVQPLWKTVWQFLSKPNIFLPYDPKITFLSIYSNELKTHIRTKNSI